VRLVARAGEVLKEANFELTVVAPAVAGAVKNSIGMKLVLIPKGSFRMGSPEGEVGRGKDEGPLHQVTIDKPFYMGIHPVTVGQFRAFVTAANYTTEAESDGKGGRSYDKATKKVKQDKQFTWQKAGWDLSEDHPVVNVTWKDAVKFCEWLSAKEGKNYRLPTEAEWEYACRGKTSPDGKTNRFWFGDSEAGLKEVANVADESLRRLLDEKHYNSQTFMPWDDGHPFTSPVGAFNKPNPFGLHDMHGNVWQWCMDVWHESYEGTPPTDGSAWLAGGVRGRRVLRGGSWTDSARDCRSACRGEGSLGERSGNEGFRVVLAPR
jgi:formylglycine-generating enzyme required for sulfatase activity